MNKTNLTIEERIEALERTIAATQANIDQKRSELSDIESAHRANLRDLQAVKQEQRSYGSVESRFKRAVKALRASGVHARTNIMQCCRGCVDAEKLGLKDESQPYAWTFGGQGMALRWSDGVPYFSGDRDTAWGRTEGERVVHYNWGNGSAEAIKAAFVAEGFEVKWDGSEYDTVKVVLS